jgi:Fic family protein
MGRMTAHLFSCYFFQNKEAQGMYLDKVWPANGESYRCLVPEVLTDETCTNQLDKSIVQDFTQASKPHGDIKQFTARYLAGGLCLKHGRTISRKRLALMRLGLERKDEVATSVINQSEQYKKVVESLSGEVLTMEKLCYFHKTLDPHHHNAGNIRQVQNWVGGDSPDKALIVPPPPEKLASLMQQWLTFFNEKPHKTLEDIIVISNQFILIHPFNDGNGRLNRALVDSMILKLIEHKDAYISPYLFRMAHQHKGYLDSPNAIMLGEWDCVFNFWDIALEWSTYKSQELSVFASKSKQKIFNKLALRQISQQAQQLLLLLESQPIVTVAYVAGQMNWSTQVSAQTLNELTHCAVLSTHILREPHGIKIFECKDILDAWNEMDKALFTEIAVY